VKPSSIIIQFSQLSLRTASPLKPGNVIINGDCKVCNVHGG
ncbi:hypothetical protein KR222_008796, partial [Zaprionus bogoriensis]